MYNFQIVKNYLDTNVNEAELLEEKQIYELIKSGGEHKDLITSARLLEKSNPDYDKIKKQIPSVLWFASFHDYKITSNIISLSNFIYCDIDKVDNPAEIKEYLKQFPFIRAIWLSFGGRGLGFTVLCDKLATNNIKMAYELIGTEINLKLDTRACKLTQSNVLSYDNEIYINPEPSIFNFNIDLSNTNSDLNFISNHSSPELWLNALCNNTNNNTRVSLALHRKEKEYSSSNDTFRPKVNFKTQISQAEFEDEDYKVFDEGRDYVVVYINKNGIEAGKRHDTLLNITSKLIYNSPDAGSEEILKTLVTINKEYCKPALPIKDIEMIVAWCWKKHIIGKLKLNLKKRYVWFNPKSDITPKQKMSISAKVTARRRRDKTSEKINKCIMDLYNNEIIITQNVLMKSCNLSVSTIKRYWKELKSEINEVNNSMRENSQNLCEIS